MKSYNEEIAGAFDEIADLMSILKENPFKIRAYKEAARRLKEEAHPITKKDADKASLMQIPRIGSALAEKIIQYIKKKKIDYLVKLRKEIPKAVRDLLKIPGLGPSRVRTLYMDLGIKSKKDIIKYAKNGEIAELKGFGDRLTESILDTIESGRVKKAKHPRGEVKPIAEKLVKILKSIKGVNSAIAAGSYRRKAKEVGDLDILVTGDDVADIAERKIKKAYPDAEFIASGDTKIAFVVMPEKLQVDIRFVPKESHGAALLYFTGSKDYNVMMRKAAINKGYLLNEYGLFRDGEYIAGATEEEVFEELGMEYAKPERRK